MSVTVPVPNLSLIVPEILMLILACGLLLVDLFIPRDRKRVVGYMALLGVIVVGVVTATFWSKMAQPATTFSGTFVLDRFALFFKEVFLFTTAITILLSLKYLEIERVSLGEYYALMLFCTLGMMIMVSGADLIVIYLGIETMALSVYVLAGFMKFDHKCTEAALKYFLLGVFISGFFLYGIALIYAATGSTQLSQIASVIRGRELAKDPLLIVAMFMLAAGFGLEIAMAPFHFWAPDVYEGAPTPVTAFISVAPKAAAFAALVRVFYHGIQLLEPHWQILLWIICAVTMTIGNVTALMQQNVKRMLAYSSVAHAGYILLGVLAANQVGVQGMAFYFFAYAFMNMGAFGLVIYLRRENIVGDDIDDFRGLAQTHPLLAVIMVVFLLSLAGIPPTAGFVGKFLLFAAAIKAGFYWLVAIAALNSVVALFYYFRIAKAMYMQNPEPLPRPSPGKGLVVALVVVGVFTLLFGIYPQPLMSLAKDTAHTFMMFFL
ncbi:MAG TPA: NADH-quinone oxidoreductase subunit N [Thermosulfidibacter takaii]|uniref:NADH-quinone oxidoreductase subunit N n=1 Tax=Thermosulfidibacter takaii TaxID=412593 RepID=A0A7C0U7A9_9BACT|nr:NADH-quinone oxidoreductase subunit N [Thermosulfidibacter takaii]